MTFWAMAFGEETWGCVNKRVLKFVFSNWQLFWMVGLTRVWFCAPPNLNPI
jgi:hypothetical protein